MTTVSPAPERGRACPSLLRNLNGNEPITTSEAAHLIRKAVAIVLSVQLLIIGVLSPIGSHILTSRWFWISAAILAPCVALGWFTRDGRKNK